MKDSAKICAGIVLYNPELELLQKNVDALLEQSINQIFLYDNNSKNAVELLNFSEIMIKSNTYVMMKNKGIAYALNQLN